MSKPALGTLLLCLAVQAAIAGDLEPRRDPKAPWQPLLAWLRAESNRMSHDLETAHAQLLIRARAANDEQLVERLSPEPPLPRPVGYGILPEIRDDEPVEPIEPRQQIYSLERLSNDFPARFRDAAILAGRAVAEPDLPLEPAVTEFEELRDRMRNLEDHLDYHAKWQRAVVENPEFFEQRNRIVERVREMERVKQEQGEAGQVETLQAEIRDRIAQFKPRHGLELKRLDDGTRLLPVTVSTDIEDDQFLDAFREIVETAFSRSDAARSMRLTLELRLQRIPADVLYPEGAPRFGTAIDASEHQARFPERSLILTTGADSTYAWAGRSVLLGSAPIHPNVLAHEFAHLLGFSDTYLRGFDGETGDPFGVVLVEWTGLENDLMGWPAGGSVSKRMIAQLIGAYGGD